MTGISKIVRQCDDSPTEVARQITAAGEECSRQQVEYWARVGYVPPRYALIATRVFDVPLHELNPSVYPNPRSAA